MQAGEAERQRKRRPRSAQWGVTVGVVGGGVWSCSQRHTSDPHSEHSLLSPPPRSLRPCEGSLMFFRSAVSRGEIANSRDGKPFGRSQWSNTNAASPCCQGERWRGDKRGARTTRACPAARESRGTRGSPLCSLARPQTTKRSSSSTRKAHETLSLPDTRLHSLLH